MPQLIAAQYAGFLSDSRGRRIIEYNLQTGHREVLSGQLYEHNIVDFAYHPQRDSYILASDSRGANHLFEVNLKTGEIIPYLITFDPFSILSFSGVYEVAIEPTGKVLVKIERVALLRYDLETGESEFIREAFPTFTGESITVDKDGSILYFDGAQRIYRINPETSEEEIVSSEIETEKGDGPDFLDITDITIGEDGTIYALQATSFETLLSIDPTTGNRTLISGRRSIDDLEGDGPLISDGRSMCFEDSNTLIILDQYNIFRVNLQTGSRSYLTTEFLPGALNTSQSTKVLMEEPGILYITNEEGPAITEFNIENNKFEERWDFPYIGSNYRFLRPQSIVSTYNGELIVTDSQGIYKIDRSNGVPKKIDLQLSPREQQIRNGANTGHLAIESDDTLVQGYGLSRVDRLNLKNFTRTTLEIPYPSERRGICVGTDGTIYIPEGANCSGQKPGLYAYPTNQPDYYIDLSSQLKEIAGIAPEPSGNILISGRYLRCENSGIDPDESIVLRFNPTTKEITTVSSVNTGTGDDIYRSSDIEFGPDGYIYINDGGYSNIVKIDPLTGDREIVVERSLDQINDFGDLNVIPQNDLCIAPPLRSQRSETKEASTPGTYYFQDNGIEVNLSSIPTTLTLTVRSHVRPPIASFDVNPRFWELDFKSSPSPENTQVSIRYFQEELNSTDLAEGDISLYFRSHQSDVWTEIPTIIETGENEVTTDGINDCHGFFAIGRKGMNLNSLSLNGWILE